MRRLLQILFVVAVAGCSESTRFSSGELTGRWQSTDEPGISSAHYRTTLMFGPGNVITVDSRSYGAYPGQSPTDLSSYATTVGSYRTEGDVLFTTSERIVYWDRFYGADSPPLFLKPPTDQGPYSNARFKVQFNRLTLDYTSYPADAPVATTATFVRVP